MKASHFHIDIFGQHAQVSAERNEGRKQNYVVCISFSGTGTRTGKIFDPNPKYCQLAGRLSPVRHVLALWQRSDSKSVKEQARGGLIPRLRQEELRVCP
jgi:hypothetical protein